MYVTATRATRCGREKHMGVPVVEEEDLRLFCLCADPAQVDIRKLKKLKTIPTPRVGDADDAVVFAPAATKHTKPAKPARTLPVEDVDDGVGGGFAQAMGRPKKKRAPSEDSASEVDVAELPGLTRDDKYKMVQETNLLIRQHGLPFDAVTTRDSAVDVQKKRDAVVREAARSGVVEGLVSMLQMFAPFIEIAVTLRFPALRIQGWGAFMVKNVGYMRGPLADIYNRYFTMFGVNTNPFVALAVIVFGSMGGFALLNYMGMSPSNMDTFFAVAAPMCGMVNTPPPSQVAVHAAVASAPPPVARNPPPPAAASVRPRPTMQPPA